MTLKQVLVINGQVHTGIGIFGVPNVNCVCSQFKVQLSIY